MVIELRLPAYDLAQLATTPITDDMPESLQLVMQSIQSHYKQLFATVKHFAETHFEKCDIDDSEDSVAFKDIGVTFDDIERVWSVYTEQRALPHIRANIWIRDIMSYMQSAYDAKYIIDELPYHNKLIGIRLTKESRNMIRGRFL